MSASSAVAEAPPPDGCGRPGGGGSDPSPASASGRHIDAAPDGPCAADPGPLEDGKEHGRWLLELSTEVAALRRGCPGQRASRPGAGVGLDAEVVSALTARIAALEEGQDREAAATIATTTHVSELERRCMRRFGQQDERLDKMLQMASTLADRMLLGESAASAEREAGAPRREPPEAELQASLGLTYRVEELEASVLSLATELATLEDAEGRPPAEPCGAAGDGASFAAALANLRDLVSEAIEGLDARVERSLCQLEARLDALQDGFDQQRLAARQLGNEVPLISAKLDQLSVQCQRYFPRVKEHDVHLRSLLYPVLGRGGGDADPLDAYRSQSVTPSDGQQASPSSREAGAPPPVAGRPPLHGASVHGVGVEQFGSKVLAATAAGSGAARPGVYQAAASSDAASRTASSDGDFSPPLRPPAARGPSSAPGGGSDAVRANMLAEVFERLHGSGHPPGVTREQWLGQTQG